jgi:four helix bundle protein
MTDEKDDLRKRTKRFALRVIKVYQALPGSGSAQVLGHQLLRSGTSVGANFRETHRALEETTYWLELLVESGAITQQKLESLLDETSQLIAILTSIAKKVRARL